MVIDDIAECAAARTALNNGIADCLHHSTTQWPVGKLPSGCFYFGGCWHFSDIADRPPYSENFHHRVCKLESARQPFLPPPRPPSPPPPSPPPPSPPPPFYTSSCAGCSACPPSYMV